MKAITVCVGYADMLAISLPRNRDHFSKYLIVSHSDDYPTHRLASQYECELLLTNAFYLHGAMFNKGLAMEQGFDLLGRDGWIMILDADTILPPNADFEAEPGYLYSPYRHMLLDPKQFNDNLDWSTLPVRHEYEHCGYCTYFHADDPMIKGVFPWYGLNWTHCGGCDSEFQGKWEFVNRYRPEWKVLHLGPTETNWCGRVSGLDYDDTVRERETNMHKVITTYRRPELSIPTDEIHRLK